MGVLLVVMGVLLGVMGVMRGWEAGVDETQPRC